MIISDPVVVTPDLAGEHLHVDRTMTGLQPQLLKPTVAIIVGDHVVSRFDVQREPNRNPFGNPDAYESGASLRSGAGHPM